MKPVWILLFGIFLVSPPVESKSKKRKRRAVPPTEQVETKEGKLLSKEKKEMDLASRCTAYCDFTTQCLDKICASNPTVSMQTCFNQCVEAKTLSPDELNNTLKEGCFRTQLIFCQTGLLKDKCECPTGPQAQCSQGQHCNLPLTEGRWACGTPAADLPANRPPCNDHYPCPSDQICTGIFEKGDSGICLSTCENKSVAAANASKSKSKAKKKP